MATKITNLVIEAHLKCRYKGHLRMMGELGEPSEYELLLKKRRDVIHTAATAKLIGLHGENEVPTGLQLTAAVLRQAKPLLLDVTMENEEETVHFDALLRVAGPSQLGDFHYIPVLFHESERPSRELQSLLGLYGLILGAIQGKEPNRGILIHGRKIEVRSINLEKVGKHVRRLMRELREIQTGSAPGFILNAHCQICEFCQRCRAAAVSKDDLSLLRGMGEKEIHKYARKGIFTVTQLSCTFRPRKKGKRAKKGQPHSAALQALAIREKTIHVFGTPALPDSEKRLYLDIEGDPERGFVYLVGVIVQANGTEEHHSFWADSPVQESRLFDQFLDIVVAHEDSWIYTYGSYEAEFLRRMGRTTGRQAIVERILTRSCNILSIVYSHIYFPLYSNGLKEIARFLGFNWTEPDASGLQSLIWRSRWEDTLSPELKETLTIYNLEDCAALRKVTEFLYGIFSTRPREEEGQPTIHEGHTVSRIEEMATVSSRREWCKAEFVVPDFAFINKRAYFDYQRERIYVRSCKSTSRTRRKRSGMKLRRKRRVDQTIEITCSSCPSCGSTALTKKADGRLTHLTFDLSIRGGGIRRRLTRFKTVRYRCEHCGMWFLPREYMRLDDYSHSMKSWAMYLHVQYRNSFKGIAEIFKETFGVPISGQAIYEFKVLLAKYYAETYEKLLRMIVAGSVIYVDETEVHLRHRGKVYVWVFTNLQEVVFIYRESREASFLPDLLRDFRGVLVSDFYPGYDSLDCPQQKCLIHLIRDFNDDLRGNPWDEELKGLAARFGVLLRSVVTTIDRYGLKKRHLGKHKGDVERFFKEVEGADYRSEIAERYRTRFLKNRDKLFVFIEHDDVSWNNNNAEHAIKRFAHYREIADGVLTEAGLKEYLVLLSICVTCEYKGISFLKFLLSKKRDLDTYCKSPGPDQLPRAAELLPEGFTLSRRIRRHARDHNLNS